MIEFLIKDLYMNISKRTFENEVFWISKRLFDILRDCH